MEHDPAAHDRSHGGIQVLGSDETAFLEVIPAFQCDGGTMDPMMIRSKSIPRFPQGHGCLFFWGAI